MAHDAGDRDARHAMHVDFFHSSTGTGAAGQRHSRADADVHADLDQALELAHAYVPNQGHMHDYDRQRARDDEHECTRAPTPDHADDIDAPLLSQPSTSMASDVDVAPPDLSTRDRDIDIAIDRLA